MIVHFLLQPKLKNLHLFIIDAIIVIDIDRQLTRSTSYPWINVFGNYTQPWQDLKGI